MFVFELLSPSPVVGAHSRTSGSGPTADMLSSSSCLHYPDPFLRSCLARGNRIPLSYLLVSGMFVDS